MGDLTDVYACVCMCVCIICLRETKSGAAGSEQTMNCSSQPFSTVSGCTAKKSSCWPDTGSKQGLHKSHAPDS